MIAHTFECNQHAFDQACPADVKHVSCNDRIVLFCVV
jgi:hypothetical protein